MNMNIEKLFSMKTIMKLDNNYDFFIDRKKIASLKTEDILDLCLINESQDLVTSRSSIDLVALILLEHSASKTLKIWNWSFENGNKAQFYLRGEMLYPARHLYNGRTVYKY